MSQKPILADVDLLLGKALDKLYSLKPNALQYVNNGGIGDAVYGNLAVGLRAQLVLMYKRLASGIVASRIPTATGSDLVKLVTSEIGAPPALGKRFAGGTIWLQRAGTLTPLAAGGVIPAGSIFTRTADQTQPIPVSSASYVSTADVSCAPNQRFVVVPVQASQVGSTANAVMPYEPDFNRGVGFTNIGIPTLFDSFLLVAPGTTGSTSVVQYQTDISGGGDGVTNDDLRQWAYASHISDNGPTLGALNAQILIENGVGHYSVLEDINTGICYIYVADKSWGSGPTLAANVQSQIEAGFSTAIVVYPVGSINIGVTASVALTDLKYLAAQADISAAVQAALRDYFDNRRDWYTWTLDGVRSAIISSDPRISSVPSAVVTWADGYSDVYNPGDTMTEPVGDPRYINVAPQPAQYGGNGTTPVVVAPHFYLAGNAVNLSFTI